MVSGFFSSTDNTTKVVRTPTNAQCGACGLYLKCKSPKMSVVGTGDKSILIIAESPTPDEDRFDEQLIGPPGEYLRRTLSGFGISIDDDCWKTNTLICTTHGKEATAKQIEYCRPNLIKAIKKYNPKIIIPLGFSAIKSLLAPLYREDVGQISTWAGWAIPCQAYNAWIMPNYDPIYVLRATSDGMPNAPVIKLWFTEYLKKAVQLKGRPFETVPDYAGDVDVVLDSGKAAAILREFIKRGGPVSWDLETNKLKPDADNAEIVCCSVCWMGKKTIAYPWTGEAVVATKELLQSNLPKINANLKFEDRWIRAKLGIDINNWTWDTMLSSHHLDNRKGITSVKFQAFVRLGQEPWDHHIKPLLRSNTPSGVNRVKEIDLRQLLLYCGLDSYLEYLIYVQQKQELLYGVG